VHSFEYNMKSRTMLCNFYKELSIPVFGEGGIESESKNHRFRLFEKPQRTSGVFLKEPVVNLWLYRQSSD
jgi:hypothetical protein